jgi:hypothetical protein
MDYIHHHHQVFYSNVFTLNPSTSSSSLMDSGATDPVVFLPGPHSSTSLPPQCMEQDPPSPQSEGSGTPRFSRFRIRPRQLATSTGVRGGL